ncbi:hypothetical protein VIGAN_09114000 [Vigna angularis var. angularis]|uniref:Uncharacterized protein n=1 Tax=Vigna angularis var. angularis TaxID=157739 RepID=A0A0S3SY63_PHAAN|nr:hypothetical protein VIGAN_09114000 [Vigna angularis var. angularis]
MPNEGDEGGAWRSLDDAQRMACSLLFFFTDPHEGEEGGGWWMMVEAGRSRGWDAGEGVVKNVEVGEDVVKNVEVLVKDRKWLPRTPKALKGSFVFVYSNGSHDRKCGVYGSVLVNRFKEEVHDL